MLQKSGKNNRYNGDKIGTIIGELTELEGTIKFSESARINGSIKGEIISQASLNIGETGKITGNIAAENVLVAGIVTGDIKCEKVEISSTGAVYGNITTNRIVIDENAVFGGKCEMNVSGKTNEAKIETAQEIFN